MWTGPSSSVTVSAVGDADVVHTTNGMNPLLATKDADGLIKKYRVPLCRACKLAQVNRQSRSRLGMSGKSY